MIGFDVSTCGYILPNDRVKAVAYCELKRQGENPDFDSLEINSCMKLLVNTNFTNGNGGLQTICDTFLYNNYIEGARKEGLLPESFNTYDAL